MARYQHSPEDLKIMPDVSPVLGRTRTEAQSKFQGLQDFVHPDVGFALLASVTGGIDFSRFPLDGPIPERPTTNGSKSRQQLMAELAPWETLSLRELSVRGAGARGHWQVVGMAADIADALEERLRGHGADGSNVMPPLPPTGFADFAALVPPELRGRGLFRHDYIGTTLLSHGQSYRRS
ncbi:MAG TPA: hypothetical protein VL752_21275 [Acidisoma sp.]|jgi:alkanesulfonate monooxygenase SsuD/methylene tetrahydromethanopterin reductase-like flavin-dependent oxidoreductase (luciferase family)|uniref:hypothetical protein n=1 Tax=Acidisoma sp. TaxID=1872115 RepID=UPI002BF77CF4|nr:hypothetical protein [Acidisoma sp.]HTI03486.1 hypothetical protein [Acidisoma sp.]